MASKMDMTQIKRWLSPAGYQGLDTFLETLPARVSHNILIAAGVAWAVAAALLLYANLQSTSYAELRTELLKTEAVKPLVPSIVENPVPAAEMTVKVDQMKKVFKDLAFTVNDGGIIVSVDDPKYYGAFLQSVYAIMALGEGYKVTMSELCEGGECKTKSSKPFLYAAFDVKKLEVKTSESPSSDLASPAGE